MKNKTVLLPVVAILSVLTFTPAKAEVLTNQLIPYSSVMDIPCTGDSVLLEGKLHVLQSVNVSPSGVQTVKYTFNPSGISGVSNQGVKYQGAGTAVITITTKGNKTIQNTQYRTYIIGQGPNNDTKFFVSFVFNTDADGNPIVEKLVFSDTCGVGG